MAQLQAEQVDAETRRLRDATEVAVQSIDRLRSDAAALPALQMEIAEMQRMHGASGDALNKSAGQVRALVRASEQRHRLVSLGEAEVYGGGESETRGMLSQIKLATLGSTANSSQQQMQQQPRQAGHDSGRSLTTADAAVVTTNTAPPSRQHSQSHLDADSDACANNTSNIIKSAPMRKSGAARRGGPVFLEAAESIMLAE